MIFAPWLISLSAQAFDAVGSSFCVSQVLSTILRPSTFFLLTFLISICAAASAGPSNGPIGPLESWAQPMMIGSFAAAECVRAAAAAAKTSAAAATITSAQRAPVACPHVSPLRPAASAGTLLFDQVLMKASRPRRASSAASRSQSESGYALPKAPLSEKISRS